MKRDDEIKKLYDKLRDDTISEVELIQFLQQIKQDPSSHALDEDLEREWSRLWEEDEKKEESDSGNIKVLKKWVWVAACSVILVVSGLSYLVFGRGQVTESTTFGEVRQVILPDGSAVTLNANSTLLWDEKMKKERRVQLQGEAFFDVVSDPSRPFIVEVEDIGIKVVGTSFNVKNRGKNREVILKTGKVEIFHNQTKQTSEHEKPVILEAGEALQYDSEQLRRTKSSGAQQASTLWKEGMLRFIDTRTEEVMEEMEMLYGVKILMEVPELSDRPLDITLPYVEWDRVGEVLALTLGVEMIKENDRYRFVGKNE